MQENVVVDQSDNVGDLVESSSDDLTTHENINQDEITEAQVSLLKTRKDAWAIIQELKSFKRYFSPNLEQNFDDISLDQALNLALSKDEQIEGDFDWELKSKAKSKLRLEANFLLTKVVDLEDELHSLSYKLRRLDRNQEDRRIDNRESRFYGREKLVNKIGRKTKDLFLGAREHLESFTKKDLQKNIDLLSEDIREERELLDSTESAIGQLDGEISSNFISVVDDGIQEFIELWKDHAKKNSRSDWVNQEITNVYIKNTILPILNQKEESGKISLEQKDNFVVNLNNYIQSRNDNNFEVKNELWSILQEDGAISYDINSFLQFIAGEKDLEIVEDIFAYLAYEQLYPQLNDFKADLSYAFSQKLEVMLNNSLKSTHLQKEWRPKDMLEEGSSSSLVGFNFLKGSETAKVLYGPLIKETDEKIYKDLQEKSLTDRNGNYIDGLFYYPTPNTIKTLVIIAAADAQEYRTVHANTTLSRLAKIDEWELILDHAIKDVPELADARDLLIDWKHSDHFNHPDIKERARHLSKNLLHDEEAAEGLRFLAEESLLNNSLIEELVDKKLIDQESGLIYQNSYKLFHDIANRKVNDTESSEARVVSSFSRVIWNWERQTRAVLRKINKEGEDSEHYQELMADFHRFVHLGSLWLKSSDDEEKLSFMSRSLVLELTQDTKNGAASTIEGLTFLSQSYDEYPFLKSEISWQLVHAIKHSPEHFLTEGGMNYLQKFYDKYGKLEHSEESLLEILFSVGEGKLSYENSLTLYEQAPGIISDDLVSFFPDSFATNEGFSFLKKFNDIYTEAEYFNENLSKLLIAIGVNKITTEQSLLLHEQAPDLLINNLALENPELFLADKKSIEFGRKFIKIYQESEALSLVGDKVIEYILKKDISAEISLDYMRILPNIFKGDAESIRTHIFSNGKLIANNKEDLKFLNKFLGIHGEKNLTLLKEYTACVESGVVNAENREKALEFTRSFRVLSPTLVEGYLKADKANITEGYIAELKQISEKMASSESFSDDERGKPYFKDLIKAVFPNNAGNWSSYESNDSCGDRSSDLKEFTYKPEYEINSLSLTEVRVRDGETIDGGRVESLKKDIIDLSMDMGKKEFDLEKIQLELVADVDMKLEEIKEAGGLKDIDISQLEELDEKIFILLADSVYGNQLIKEEDLKKLVLRYEFAFFDNIRDYISGTTDRVSQAINQDYALMSELHSFFVDRIKEINRRLIRVGWENETIREGMPSYFENISRERAEAKTEDQMNRHRVDRLGLSDSFIEQISRTIEKRRGKKYSPETVVKLIRYYENITGGLVANSSISKNKSTKAIYGQIRSQREKTLSTIESITGEKIDPENFHLGDVNLGDLATSLAEIDVGSYNEEQFKAFTTLRLMNLFSEEKNLLETELGKFESESGKRGEVVNGYFTKTKESANARMVGGVCVSGDNPTDKEGNRKEDGRNMWDTENFFQFVLQNPETHRCQGVILLHHFEEDDQKVLTASFNPSSTFLYSTDESSLFVGIMNELENFAKENGFDKILMSQNKNIRTNRTGGEFEKAMDKRQRQIGEIFAFSEEKLFSYSPQYSIQEMDVIWKKT